ncbi:hypothetical protein Tco_1253305 [Tanacetum coccineum]
MNMKNSNNSFVSVLKRGSQSHVTPEITKPALVLDDTCIKEFDFGMSLMGKAKDVSAIPNLPCIISKEGFQNVKLSYLGGMCVLFEFDSLTTKEKFLNHSGIGSWFTELIQATSSFENDERIVWIFIEGLPIKAWTPNTFRKIASLWVSVIEASLHRKRKLLTKTPTVAKKESDEPKFPLGFTPDNNNHEKNVVENIKDTTERVQSLSNKLNDRCSNRGFSSQKYELTLLRKDLHRLFSELYVWYRTLSEHRPILYAETNYDSWPSPFVFFHSWFAMEGFNSFVETTWKSLNIVEPNDFNSVEEKVCKLSRLLSRPGRKKLTKGSNDKKINIQHNLSEVDKLINQGKSNVEILIKRITLLNDLQELNNRNAMKISQKAKI